MNRTVLAMSACFALAYGAAFAQVSGAPRLVLKGYDPVAYFTEQRPVKGNPSISHDWDEGRYHFASPHNRELFAADPERYAPRFGGYCTGSMSRNVRNEGDPEAWTISEGRLYVFGGVKFKHIAETQPGWLAERIPLSKANWQKVRQAR